MLDSSPEQSVGTRRRGLRDRRWRLPAARAGRNRHPRKACSKRCSAASTGGARQLPPRVSSYADPRSRQRRERGDDRRERRASVEHHGGPSSGFCVRTCDGRYFPLQRSGGMSPAELCKSFCPARQDQVFSGSKIDHAVAPTAPAMPISTTPSPIATRSTNCTCNGKDALGLARMDAPSDPTLRPGDIVATNEGLATFSGKAIQVRRVHADRPVRRSSEWRAPAVAIKVTPAPPRGEDRRGPPAEDSQAEAARAGPPQRSAQR